MKKSIKFLCGLLITATAFLATSCSNDPANLIVGTWSCVSSEYYEDGKLIYSADSQELSALAISFVFDDKNNVVYTEAGDILTATYVLANDKLTLTFDDTDLGAAIYDCKLSKKEMVLTNQYTENNKKIKTIITFEKK